jgi:uncharacterized coiled-coil protein SlyX
MEGSDGWDGWEGGDGWGRWEKCGRGGKRGKKGEIGCVEFGCVSLKEGLVRDMSTAVSAERLHERAEQAREARLAELEIDVRRLTNQVQQHVQGYGFDRTSFFQQHSSASERLGGLDAKMTGMEAKMSGAEATMTAAEAKMTAADAKTAEMAGKMQSLVGRVEKLERPWWVPRAKQTNEKRLGVLLSDLEKMGGGA